MLRFACWCKAQTSQHKPCPKAGSGYWTPNCCLHPPRSQKPPGTALQRAGWVPSPGPSPPAHLCHPLSPARPALFPRGLVLDSSSSSKKCSCNHFIAYTMIVLHCRIKRFFHIQCRSQPQSLLYLLTHFIKFTSFLLCLCTSVPSAVCTKSYWHFNIKLLWQEDIPLAK